jgi:hypothetical protein
VIGDDERHGGAGGGVVHHPDDPESHGDGQQRPHAVGLQVQRRDECEEDAEPSRVGQDEHAAVREAVGEGAGRQPEQHRGDRLGGGDDADGERARRGRVRRQRQGDERELIAEDRDRVRRPQPPEVGPRPPAQRRPPASRWAAPSGDSR